jgi:hypothetical protein
MAVGFSAGVVVVAAAGAYAGSSAAAVCLKAHAASCAATSASASVAEQPCAAPAASSAEPAAPPPALSAMAVAWKRQRTRRRLIAPRAAKLGMSSELRVGARRGHARQRCLRAAVNERRRARAFRGCRCARTLAARVAAAPRGSWGSWRGRRPARCGCSACSRSARTSSATPPARAQTEKHGTKRGNTQRRAEGKQRAARAHKCAPRVRVRACVMTSRQMSQCSSCAGSPPTHARSGAAAMRFSTPPPPTLLRPPPAPSGVAGASAARCSSAVRMTSSGAVAIAAERSARARK